MIISKFENFNKYFQKTFLVIILFSLTLIPWIEFFNANLEELDFIFNDNLFILLIIYFLFISLTYIVLSFLITIKKYSLVSFISISIWVLFQHNFLKANVNILFKKIEISLKYSSEISLIIILFLIYLFFYLIKRKKFFTNFFLFFLTLNLLFSFLSFATEFYSKKRIIEISNNNINQLIKNKKKPNIYYFILDAMMPLNEFENFYKNDLSDFKFFFNQKNYKYFQNTLNFYPNTADTFTSLFYLEEEIFINSNDKSKKNEYKPYIYKTFPGIMKKPYNPKLISELNQLGYEFKWIGNSFANCSRYNYKYCLSNKKEQYIDFYLLQSFLKKTPLLQIFNKLTEVSTIQKYFRVNERNNAISRLRKFINSNENYLRINSTFYFIHHLSPHWPYIHDQNCNYKQFEGKTNFEGYKNSYLCVIKRIEDIIKIIDKIDKDAIVIIQSDHSWEMSNISEIQYGKRMQIFNLVKNNIYCDKKEKTGLNNIQVMNYLLGCLKNNSN